MICFPTFCDFVFATFSMFRFQGPQGFHFGILGAYMWPPWLRFAPLWAICLVPWDRFVIHHWARAGAPPQPAPALAAKSALDSCSHGAYLVAIVNESRGTVVRNRRPLGGVF